MVRGPAVATGATRPRQHPRPCRGHAADASPVRVQVYFVALRLHGLRRTHTSMAEAAKAEAAEAIKQRYVAVTAKAQELKDSFTNSE